MSMLGTMRIVIIIVILLLSQPLMARDVYKWVTEDGEVVYSESYQPGAEKIRVSDEKRKSSLNVENLDKESEAAATGEYTNFDIVQPGNDETIRSAEGSVSVGLSISPPLGSGHIIHLYVDGRKLDSDITTSQLVLQQLSRGTHTLNAEILDAEGNKMKETGSTTFHLRQAEVE
ncbi:MAG: DUF4124 domain-containing protein [Candidatus Thiodiazotropha sp. 6PLUC9]